MRQYTKLGAEWAHWCTLNGNSSNGPGCKLSFRLKVETSSLDFLFPFDCTRMVLFKKIENDDRLAKEQKSNATTASSLVRTLWETAIDAHSRNARGGKNLENMHLLLIITRNIDSDDKTHLYGSIKRSLCTTEPNWTDNRDKTRILSGYWTFRIAEQSETVQF